jgi:hypothetical protein
MTTQERVIESGAHSAAFVTILHGPEKRQSELNAAKLVELLGGEVVFLRLPDARAGDAMRWIEQIASGTTVVASAEALAAAMPGEESGVRWLSRLTTAGRGCLIFGFCKDAVLLRLARVLSNGAYTSIERPPSSAGRVDVANELDICRQLSGVSFDASAHESDAVFVRASDNADCAELIRFAGKPIVLAAKRKGPPLFLVGSDVADLDEPIHHRAPMSRYFSRLAPLLIFLRLACGDAVWHGDSPRACLIVDDPLLKPRYGFLDFDKLLSLTRTLDSSANIAFIPWNYRRSDARTADLFKRFPSRLSLSIHGCEHTRAEFASTDVGFLRDQASRGMQWMARHRDLTGVAFDTVMVFPQGHFSIPAMAALQSCGYLAAVNSTGRPVDGGLDSLRLRDLLEVAVTRFDGFPLFIRHYPNNIADLAMDLFLGKAVLLVEHHGFFKDGYGSLEEIVGLLNRLEPRLEWTNLSTLCSRASWSRTGKDGDRQMRFYTDQFQFTNTCTEARRYTFVRRQSSGQEPTAIDINGARAETIRSTDGSAVRAELLAGETVDISVIRQQSPVVGAAVRRGLGWRTQVFLRRHLSEFRDNHVDRNPFLSRVAARVRRSLAAKR